jgi:hypothetical protein
LAGSATTGGEKFSSGWLGSSGFGSGGGNFSGLARTKAKISKIIIAVAIILGLFFIQLNIWFSIIFKMLVGGLFLVQSARLFTLMT